MHYAIKVGDEEFYSGFPRLQFILSLLGQYWHVSDDFKNNSREITASGFREDLLSRNKLPSPSIPNKITVIKPPDL